MREVSSPTQTAGTITTWRQAWQVLDLAAPFHPILVHFTIALFIASGGADLLGRLFASRSLSEAGWWTMAGAWVATPFTLITGAISRLRLPMEEGVARSFLRAHMALGLAMFGWLTVLVLWRGWLWQSGQSTSWWYLAVFAAGAALMTLQGYLGGELVYRYGTEVERTYRELPGHPTHDPAPALFPRRRDQVG
jgi:uncharacterized membrane protein